MSSLLGIESRSSGRHIYYLLHRTYWSRDCRH